MPLPSTRNPCKEENRSVTISRLKNASDTISSPLEEWVSRTLKYKSILQDLTAKLGPLQGKRLAVVVSAGPKAYQALYLISRLVKEKAEVCVFMKEGTEDYIREQTFRAISQSQVRQAEELGLSKAQAFDEIMELNGKSELLGDFADYKDARLFKDKNIIVGITGSIAAYKALELVERLIYVQAKVRVALTATASKFIGRAAFNDWGVEAGEDEFKEINCWKAGHIAWADWADMMIVAPVTANTIAKRARGIADNFLTNILLSLDNPVLFAPAMETQMYKDEATQGNIRILKSFKTKSIFLSARKKVYLLQGRQVGGGCLNPRGYFLMPL